MIGMGAISSFLFEERGCSVQNTKWRVCVEGSGLKRRELS